MSRDDDDDDNDDLGPLPEVDPRDDRNRAALAEIRIALDDIRRTYGIGTIEFLWCLTIVTGALSRDIVKAARRVQDGE